MKLKSSVVTLCSHSALRRFLKIVLASVRRTVFGTEFSSHPSGNRDIIFGVTVATRKTFIFTATLRIVNDQII